MPSLHDTILRLRPDSCIELLDAEGFWPRLMACQQGTEGRPR